MRAGCSTCCIAVILFSISEKVAYVLSDFDAYFEICFKTSSHETTCWQSMLALNIKIILGLCIFKFSSFLISLYFFFLASSSISVELLFFYPWSSIVIVHFLPFLVKICSFYAFCVSLEMIHYLFISMWRICRKDLIYAQQAWVIKWRMEKCIIFVDVELRFQVVTYMSKYFLEFLNCWASLLYKQSAYHGKLIGGRSLWYVCNIPPN